MLESIDAALSSAEHEEVVRALRPCVLRRAFAKRGRGRDVPMSMVADVLEFFERFAGRHHDKEEETLFPLLARHGVDAAGGRVTCDAAQQFLDIQDIVVPQRSRK